MPSKTPKKPSDSTLAFLRKRYQYDELTGNIYYAEDTQRSSKGDIAGYKHKTGYIILSDGHGSTLKAHHVAYFLKEGVWPPAQMDHRNRDRTDNRWENIRLASDADNQNNSGIRITNTSGYRGVSEIAGGKYSAKICVKGIPRPVQLIYSMCPKEAAACYELVAKMVHGEFYSPPEYINTLPKAPDRFFHLTGYRRVMAYLNSLEGDDS